MFSCCNTVCIVCSCCVCINYPVTIIIICRFEAAQVQSWIFSSFSYFSNILSEANINILGLYKAFWYTGSAFTKYFNHIVTGTS